MTTEKKRRSTPKMKAEDIRRELLGALGNVSVAASRLGVSRAALHLRIKNDPDLQQILTDAREAIVDRAENALLAAVTEKQAWAVCFTLKCLGKDRGYVEAQQVQQSGSVEVIIRREDKRNTTSQN
jgi:hypothetical protein